MVSESNEHKSIAKGAFWGLLGGIGVKLSSFITTIILARFFPVEDIGQFNLALAIIGMITSFSDLGLTAALPRYIPHLLGKDRQQEAYDLTRMIYWIVVGLSIVLALAVFISAPIIAEYYQTPGLKIMLEILAGYVIFFNIFNFNTSFLMSMGTVKENNLLTNGQNLLRVFLVISMFFMFGPQAWTIPAVFVISFIPSTLFSLMYAQKTRNALMTKGKKSEMNWNLIMEVLPFGLTLTLIGTLWTQVMSFDKAMLGIMLPIDVREATLGIYSIVTSFAGIVMMFAATIIPIFFPTITRALAKNDLKKVHRLSQVGVQWSIMLMVPFTIIAIAFPDILISMFYGATYATGATVLTIASIGIFVRALSLVQGSLLAAMKILKIEIIAGIVAFATNAILNYFLIPLYGMEGSALATLVSFCIVTALLTYYSNKYVGFWFSKEIYKPIMAGITVLGICILIKPMLIEIIANANNGFVISENALFNLIIQKTFKMGIFGLLMALVTGMYFILLIITKAFHKEDQDIAKAALVRARVPSPIVSFIEKMMQPAE